MIVLEVIWQLILNNISVQINLYVYKGQCSDRKCQLEKIIGGQEPRKTTITGASGRKDVFS